MIWLPKNYMIHSLNQHFVSLYIIRIVCLPNSILTVRQKVMDVHRLPIILIASIIVIDERYQIHKLTKLQCYCTSLCMLCAIAIHRCTDKFCGSYMLVLSKDYIRYQVMFWHLTFEHWFDSFMRRDSEYLISTETQIKT